MISPRHQHPDVFHRAAGWQKNPGTHRWLSRGVRSWHSGGTAGTCRAEVWGPGTQGVLEFLLEFTPPAGTSSFPRTRTQTLHKSLHCAHTTSSKRFSRRVSRGLFSCSLLSSLIFSGRGKKEPLQVAACRGWLWTRRSGSGASPGAPGAAADKSRAGRPGRDGNSEPCSPGSERSHGPPRRSSLRTRQQIREDKGRQQEATSRGVGFVSA